MSSTNDIVIETVLRFRVGPAEKRGEIVHVAGTQRGIAVLAKLLSRASEKGAGLPPGSVSEGTLADINYEPSYFLNSDGERMEGIPPMPAALLTFPRVPTPKAKAKKS